MGASDEPMNEVVQEHVCRRVHLIFKTTGLAAYTSSYHSDVCFVEWS